MNNEKYNHIIDEAYEKYKSNTPEQHVVGSDTDLMRHSMIYKNKLCHLSGYPIFERLSKEEFINKCKIDSEFSEKWGLKIEERKLSFKERRDLAHEYAVFHNKLPLCIDAHGHEGIPKYHEVINKTGWNIPIKLITITYQENKIEVYE